MKVGNKLLNRIVAVATLAVVLLGGFWSLGLSDSYAIVKENRPFLNGSYDFGYVDPSNITYELYKYQGLSGKIVTFYNMPDDGSSYSFSRCIISTSELKGSMNTRHFSGTEEDYDKGTYNERSTNTNMSDYFTLTVNGVEYHVVIGGLSYSMSPQPYYTWFGNLGSVYRSSISNKTFQKNFKVYLNNYLSGNLDSIFTMVTEGEDVSTDESTWEGGQDKPKKDADIGYLVLKNTNVNQQSDLGTLKDGVLPLYFNIDWKDKTSTGFSLTKNKYARTFIQMEVESKFVVYSDVKHTKIKHKFDNYGERGWLSKNIDPSNKPITFDSGDINNALPLTYNEILNQVDKNKIYGSLGQAIFPIGYNFLIRYRIVCTNSLTVIPDTSSGWHAGPWASTILSGDDINDTSSNKSDHEGYGDDKNKNGETDDINHTRTDYDDNQDAKDNINDKKNDKSSLDLDSAKEFINQVSDVPKMIADIFSFLPDWVKYSFAFGFALIPILIIFKLVRG